MIANIVHFVKSSRGKTALLVIACLVIFYFIKSCRKNSGKGAVELPKLPKVTLIGNHAENPTDMGKKIIVQNRKTYSPYKPAKPMAIVESEQAISLPEISVHREVEEYVPQPAMVHLYHPVQPKQKQVKIVKKKQIQVIPLGTMIPCRLITSINSGTESPIIAKVIKTVKHNGRVLIPYGSEIHGSVEKEHRQDRVNTKTHWGIVLPSGVAVKLVGVGLNRDYDGQKQRYGSQDGSIGIKGEIIRSHIKRNSKKVFAKGLASLSRFAQKRGRTVLGEEVLTTARNGGLEGVATVIDDYAGSLEKEANKNKPFVRVLAGTEFYIYVTDEITKAPIHSASGNDLGNALKQREVLMKHLRNQLDQ